MFIVCVSCYTLCFIGRCVCVNNSVGDVLFVCLIQQVVIQDGHCRHGFHYGYGTGEHTCVVAPAGFQGGGLAVLGYGELFHQDGGNGFEGNAEVDILSVGDASLYATATVRLGGDASVAVGNEDVVLLTTP